MKGFSELINRLKKKNSTFKASLNIILLVSITSILSYPSSIWYLSLLAGVVLIGGIFFKIQRLIPIGVILVGSSFYLSYLSIPLSILNVAFLIIMFIFFYGSIIYLNEMIKRDIIKSNYEGTVGSGLKDYIRRWRGSALKNLSIGFVLAFISFIVIRRGTFEFFDQMNNTILMGLSAILVFSILVLLYILFIRLPSAYFEGEDSG